MTKVCKGCLEEKSVSDFPKNKLTKDGLLGKCKACKNKQDKALYKKKKETDPEWWAKESARVRAIKRFQATGFTSEMFEVKLAEQGYCCAICGTDDPKETNWHADHCHLENKPRGILCKKCNTGIGMLQDNKEIVFAAYEYLKHYTR